MKRLIYYEIRQQFGAVFFLCALASVVMALTQFVPEDWRVLAVPMRFSNFIYTQLQKDVSRGESDSTWIDYEECERVVYSQEVISAMEEIMNTMNPDRITDRELLMRMEFALTEDELKGMLNRLGMLIGEDNYYNNGAEYLFRRYQSNVYPYREIQDPGELMIRFRDDIIHCLFWGEYYREGDWFGFNVSISEEEREVLEKALEDITDIMNNLEGMEERFLHIMDRIRELDWELGGGTTFASKRLSFVEPFTYEQAVSYYEEEIEAEGLAWSYARYCSDYMGIVYGILPAIPAIFAMIRERRAKVREVVYPREVSSERVITARILGLWLLYAGLLLSVMLGASVYLWILTQDASFLVSFLSYTIYWLLPGLMISTALPGLFALIMENEMVPAAFWIVICFFSMDPLIGDYPIWKPVLRFNEIGKGEVFADNFQKIVMNRMVMVIGSILCIIIMIRLYERKRRSLNQRGKWYGMFSALCPADNQN